MRWVRRLGGVLAVIVVLLAAVWLIMPPSHDRDWQAFHSREPFATETVPALLSEIRDWSYAEDGSVTEQRWITAELDPRDLVRVWFLVEPFTDIDAVAHTMLSFEFSDGSAYVASVEARREKGETYQPIRAGLFPTYEYLVVWATERDMYANTVYWSKGELLMYPLDLTEAQAGAVLGGMLELTSEVALRPRWYNTFFSNCTNVLARTVNNLSPGALPRAAAWYLPGYSDRYLYDLGYVAGAGTFAEVEARAQATDAVKAALPGPADGFAARLRSALP